MGFALVCARWLGVGVAGVLLLAAASHAQDRREALDALERERTQQIRDGQLRTVPQWAEPQGFTWLEPVAGEAPCFAVHRVQWQGAPRALDEAPQDLRAFAGACLGAQSIERLRQNLQARLVGLGYVTSSLSLPPQNLADGVLRLQVHLGRVTRIDRRGPAQAISRNALAVQPGDVLNLRDIEQTLENTGRLPS